MATRLRSLQPFAAQVVPVRREVCGWVGHGARLAVPALSGGATNRGRSWVLHRYSVRPAPPDHSGTRGPCHSLRRRSPSHGESVARHCESAPRPTLAWYERRRLPAHLLLFGERRPCVARSTGVG